MGGFRQARYAFFKRRLSKVFGKLFGDGLGEDEGSRCKALVALLVVRSN
jgi:hypothetical protein